MALDPKMLKRFLDNPASFSAQDMGLEDKEQMAPDESEDNALELPEVDPEAELLAQAPEIADPDEENQEQDLMNEETEHDALAISTDEVEDGMAMRKVQNSLKNTSEEEDQEISSDMKAPMELRKKALQKIKAKYLGQ